MAEKGNALDRYQQAVNMYGHQNVFEHDLLRRSNDLSKASVNIATLANETYITKDVHTEKFEKELADALGLISQISTSLGIKLSDLAISKINELKEAKR